MKEGLEAKDMIAKIEDVIKVQALFLVDRKLKQKLKIQAAKEGKDMSDIVEEQIKRYLKEHGDGNPAFQITKWLSNPDFLVTPAFFETALKWKEYLKRSTRKEVTAVESKAIQIKDLARKAYYEAKA